jgi:hypothetical protein
MSKQATDTHNKKSTDEIIISSGPRVAKGLRARGAETGITFCRGHTGRIAGKTSRSHSSYS